MTDDYQLDDLACPACGHYPTRSRHCSELRCEDGWIDNYDEDPINLSPGEEIERCPECHGTGIERWCPACGADYWPAERKRRKAEKRAKKRTDNQDRQDG